MFFPLPGIPNHLKGFSVFMFSCCWIICPWFTSIYYKASEKNMKCSDFLWRLLSRNTWSFLLRDSSGFALSALRTCCYSNVSTAYTWFSPAYKERGQLRLPFADGSGGTAIKHSWNWKGCRRSFLSGNAAGGGSSAPGPFQPWSDNFKSELNPCLILSSQAECFFWCLKRKICHFV